MPRASLWQCLVQALGRLEGQATKGHPRQGGTGQQHPSWPCPGQPLSPCYTWCTRRPATTRA